MQKVAVSITVLLATVVAACVTINVYFPEAAAVEAADRIIDKVRGEDTGDTTSTNPRRRSGRSKTRSHADSRRYGPISIPARLVSPIPVLSSFATATWCR